MSMEIWNQLYRLLETVRKAAQDGRITVWEGWTIAQQLIILAAELSRFLSWPFVKIEIETAAKSTGEYEAEPKIITDLKAFVTALRTALADQKITPLEAVNLFLLAVAFLNEIADILRSLLPDAGAKK